MMKGRTLEFLVGLFVLLGLASLLFLTLEVAGWRPDPQQQYSIYARFQNASGLASRARVSIAGVTVGRVGAIRIDPVDYSALVELRIDQAVDYLTLDTIAAIKTAGVLGERYVSLSVGGDPELLVAGDIIEDTQPALVLEDLIGKFLSTFAAKP